MVPSNHGTRKLWPAFRRRAGGAVLDGHYDAIIIGSGIGGMAAASLLTQLKGYRVLVLEQHFTPGGFTHSFSRRGGFKWDVGTHYVGCMAPGHRLRNAFDFVTNKSVAWAKMQDPFESFNYPDFTFNVHSDPQRYQEDLIRHFPQEASGIRRYFKDMRIFPKHLPGPLIAKLIDPKFYSNFLRARRFAKLTLSEGLDHYFESERLKSLLASQWGDYGLPPSQASFLFHMAVVEHYVDGGYYPVGGSQVIAKAVEDIIASREGEILTSHKVTKVVVERGSAIGVEVENKGQVKNFYAKEIYSNAGAYNTFTNLLDPSLVGTIRRDLQAQEPGDSAITLYLGLNKNPASLGVHGQNVWIYTDWDHDALFAKRHKILDGQVANCFVSFPSLRDPTATKHTVEILAFVNYAPFKQWENSHWRRRGPEYKALKARIAAALLALAETKIPGLTACVSFQELSTPLSVKHFSLHPRGQIYGFPMTPARLTKNYLRPKTPIKNLYLVGADAVGFGIGGSLIGGILAVGAKHGLVKISRRVFG